MLTPEEAGSAREGDHVYFLAPPERARVLDRFFVDMPQSMRPDPRLLGDFFIPSEATLGALAEIYSLPVETENLPTSLSDFFLEQLGRTPRQGDVVRMGDVVLQAHTVADGRLVTVGLQLDEPEPLKVTAVFARIKARAHATRHYKGVMAGRVRARCRAGGWRKCRLHEPGRRQQDRGPDQIARHRVLQERQRSDVALISPAMSAAYMPLNAHTAKFVVTKKSSEHDNTAGTTMREMRKRLETIPTTAGIARER